MVLISNALDLFGAFPRGTVPCRHLARGFASKARGFASKLQKRPWPSPAANGPRAETISAAKSDPHMRLRLDWHQPAVHRAARRDLPMEGSGVQRRFQHRGLRRGLAGRVRLGIGAEQGGPRGRGLPRALLCLVPRLQPIGFLDIIVNHV